MGTRNTRESILVLPHLHYHFYYYSLFVLCYLASLVTPSIVELLEARTVTAQGCSQAERDALLTFKSSIQDPSNRLSSWNSQHGCCKWSGVVCYNDTTTTSVHVVKLNLANPNNFDDYTALHGEKLSSSLLSLTHLESLNLSWNDFGGAQIPEFIGTFQKLRYLDLQQSNFSGTIPPHLGNLSSLCYLRLQTEWADILRVKSLDWLTGLSALTYLDMSNVNLSVVSHNWFSTMNILSSLQELRLSYCSLDQIPSSLSHLNLTSLVTLDLSGNSFNSTLPSWLWQLTSLSYLYLSYSFHGMMPVGIRNLSSLTELVLQGSSLSGSLPNEICSLTHLTKLDFSNSLIGGPIPIGIGNLTSLSQLFLSYCSFSGPIPVEIGYLTSLTTLDLQSNSLNGSIPPKIGNLTSLIVLNLNTNSLTGHVPSEIGKLFNLNNLDLSSNFLKGVLSQLHFANLTNLQYLDLSNNSLLAIAIDHNWAPPFQLLTITLDSVKLGPTFPMWLRSQNSIIKINLSNTSIEGYIPNWFWASSIYVAIDLSYNKIRGTLPLSLESYTNLNFLNLCSNLLEGPIPKLPNSLLSVDLSHNFLSGPLPLNHSPFYYILSYNQIHERMPLSVCNLTNTAILDLSHNQIYGEIPYCEWPEPNNLKVLHLGNNNLSGKIPSSIGRLNNIRSLHLNSNNLYGQIPSSLEKCSELLILEIGNNKLSGNIPTWIGQSLQGLRVLQLRSNMFSGDIPLNIGQLSNLQIIDFSNNNLIGSIPHSLGNLSAIISTSRKMSFDFLDVPTEGIISEEHNDDIMIVMKGDEYSFSKTLEFVKSIDLSNNSLDGEIPKELGFLEDLQTLNLSKNHLKGNIPNTIDRMKSLETLDLSYNMLSGAIPQGLSALNYLNHLNLSYNNLSGMIPQGYQLQTLQDPSIYKGNINLCGAPINKSCFGYKNYTTTDEEHEDLLQMLPEYLGIVFGFLLGLWSVLVILLFKKGWRNFYFFMVDKICDTIHVLIKVRLNRWMESP